MSQTLRSAGVIALFVAVVALGAGGSLAQPRHGGGEGITVSDDVNFQGATMTFRNDVPDLRDFRLNDRISSLQVAQGESWEVCENTNYGGRCVVVSGSERDLRTRGFNDIISSMRRVQGRDDRGSRDDRDARGSRDDRDARGSRDDRDDRGSRDDRDDRGGPGITVFDDVNFQGPTVTFRRDVPDLRDFQFNDRISSLQLAPGESWELCEDTNYGGRCVVVSGSERDLRARGFNDIISSMRRVRGRDGRGDRDDRR